MKLVLMCLLLFDLIPVKAKALKMGRSPRPRFPTYRQTLYGGFGERDGGAYVLEMETFPFKEEDIRVKVTPTEIQIEGKMEEKMGEDFMMYVFTKKCRPPVEVDVATIECKFSGDTLVLTARTNR